MIMPATCRTAEANLSGTCGLTSEPVVSWIFSGNGLKTRC